MDGTGPPRRASAPRGDFAENRGRLLRFGILGCLRELRVRPRGTCLETGLHRQRRGGRAACSLPGRAAARKRATRTVNGEIDSARPISLFDRPSAISRSTACCRGVRASRRARCRLPALDPPRRRAAGSPLPSVCNAVPISGLQGFAEVAVGAGGQRLVHQTRVVERRDDDDCAVPIGATQALDGLGGGEAGKRQVEDEEGGRFRRDARGQAQRLVEAARFAYGGLREVAADDPSQAIAERG